MDLSFNTTELAKYQDELALRIDAGDVVFGNYKANDLAKLKSNAWFRLAQTLSPGNLVIRQFCLIDLVSRIPDNYNRIYDMMKLLSVRGNVTVWAEGYSYWLYTKEILSRWLLKFNGPGIQSLCKEIDTGFYLTSYVRGGVKYPACYGDLSDISLALDCIENGKNLPYLKTAEAGIFTMIRDKEDTIYTIHPTPIGLNVHTPSKSECYRIVSGVSNFKFYTEYNKKYTSKFSEIIDVFNYRRLLSLLF